MNNRGRIQIVVCLLLFMPSSISVNAKTSNNVEIIVNEPQYSFTSEQPLVIDDEAKLAAYELELSIRLRPLLDSGEYGQAYQEILAFGGEPSAARLLLSAQLLSLDGNYDAAIVEYKAAIKKMPNLRRAHAGLGTLYLLTERHKLARERLSKAVSLGANDVQTFAQLGYLNHKLYNPWSAIKAYQHALMLDPDNRQWQSGLLAVLVASGNVTSAGALVDELLQTDPSAVALWQQRANLAMQSQNMPRALSSLETAIRLGDDNPQNRLAAALLHMREQNYVRATQLLNENIIKAGMGATELYPLVVWLLRQDAIANAALLIEAVDQINARATNRQRSLITEMQGRLALARDNSDKAVSLLRQAIDFDSANGEALLRLARLHLARDELTRALLMFQRAETIEATRKFAMLGSAQVAIESREYTKALNLVRKIQQQFPGSYELDGYVQSLASLHSAKQSSE
jgi:tetratricopeptide (TPR) repeat protein|tara:strand:+ start:8727 stop:10100 length:1374 start_codon:yes stop_codon:yes gene_type:complete